MNESALYAFLKSIFNNSNTFQGRFAVLEGYGNDLNADNNDDVLISNAINQQKWTKKYPCVPMMPPRETGSNVKNNTTRYLIQLYFCDTTYFDGNGQTKAINVQTNTSKQSIQQVWEKMRNEAGVFHKIMLDKFYNDISILQTIRPVKSTPVTFERFSMKNNDRLSGVVMTFELDLVTTCTIENYSNITLADYTNFNSDKFLLAHVGGGGSYAYECTYSMYDGVAQTNTGPYIYASVDSQKIPVQAADRKTIPLHTQNDMVKWLSYDRNWITFLNSLPIAAFLTFRTSPCSIYRSASVTDPGFPDAQIRGVHYPSGDPLYGEGFQIEYPRDKTFRIEIDFLYEKSHITTKLHTIIYTQDEMIIDGAIVPLNKFHVPSV